MWWNNCHKTFKLHLQRHIFNPCFLNFHLKSQNQFWCRFLRDSFWSIHSSDCCFPLQCSSSSLQLFLSGRTFASSGSSPQSHWTSFRLRASGGCLWRGSHPKSTPWVQSGDNQGSCYSNHSFSKLKFKMACWIFWSNKKTKSEWNGIK